MASAFIRRVKDEIAQAGGASPEIVSQIEEELERAPTAELWILRGDAIQLCEDDEIEIEDAEASYRQALELDPRSADAFESLGHYTYAILDDARGALEYFHRAIELGAGPSAREGLREAQEEIADAGDS